MLNPRLAGRYAKSIIDLAVERDQLEVVHDDMQYLAAVIKHSKEFTNLLQSPVVSPEKKTQVFDAIAKGKVSDVTIAFAHLLISKNREFYLPEITKAYIEQYNAIKGIHRVKLTTATEVSDEVKSSIINKIKADTEIDNIEIETAVKPELIGGFVLEFNNNLVDASILRDLRDVKTQFDKNAYVQEIR
ncbi:MAG TPA: ATP synthase F1 subunit delta [Segetibacter sp.]|jgi:F-type H+-transporting ATPase subunit delta